MIQFEQTVIGLDQVEALTKSFPEITRKAASLAINDSARRARSMSKKEIMKQVAFKSSYLGGERSSRLSITDYAKENNLQAKISGRFEPTSLVQFLQNKSSMLGNPGKGFVVGKGKARLRIKPGGITAVDQAFLLRLKNGNMGFAVRSETGNIHGSTKQYRIGKTNLFLLYGPSVNQVFNTVREDVSVPVAGYLAGEFDRQFKRLING